MISKIEEAKSKPILMRPPFQWAQNLHFIFIEVKYAYRHDVSGCAAIYNETINATDEKIYISAFCKDMDNNLFFEVSFPFWAEVNATTLKYEYQSVGKHYISLEKLNKPARWR